MDDQQQESKPEESYSVNITPLVDVSLVLVLIFMVTSPFFVKPLVAVKLPEAVSAESEDRQNITVSVAPGGGFFINESETPVEKADLQKSLEEAMKATGFDFMLIRADERIPHGEIQDLMRIAKRAKVKRIAFATSPRFQ